MGREISEKKLEWNELYHHLHSVEISMDELDLPYQFKIWENEAEKISLLIKADSWVLPRLKIGDTFNIKCYSSQSVYPYENVKTTIRNITKNEEGRLRGHYLVRLEVLSD